MHKIKLMRESKGLTQKELAQQLNITQQSICKYETGQCFPNLSTLREISEFFDTTVDYLLAEDTPEDTQEVPRLHLTRDEYVIIQNYRQLPPQSKKIIRNITIRMLRDSDV